MKNVLGHGLLGLALVAMFAAPSVARPGRGGGGGHGAKLDKMVESLDLDEATAAKVKAQFEAGRAQSKAVREEKRAAGKQLHALMEAESPDRAAIMAQIEKVGALDVALHKARMGTMLDVRALLTPEQRTQLKEMRGKRGKRGKGGKWGKRRRGEGAPGGEAPKGDDEPGEE